ncbi:DUF3795 domain-containing protein [Candidatus Sumerlaeota bacterium]|nr:DUF3795 domain-containing protein [Candidatus Sumerlaeota bacterium]
MKEAQYGPCGLFCGACGATDCDGCLSDKIDDWVRRCKFRKCARDNKIEVCCFCPDYPCKEFDDFMNDKWPHHWTIKENMEYIKENGVKKWLEKQKEEWTCKNCGAEIIWYQRECSCGAKLKAWELPE